jgi:hypothetical protein
VALAAPVIHGGVFGRRLLGARRATPTKGRPYDCQQVLALFVKQPRSANDDRPIRQAWTISRAKTLDRILATEACPIVDSKKLVIRRERPESVAPIADKVRMSEVPVGDIEALALGGGGWRGAFGGIGAVMYFAHTKRWAKIRDVVGISGGSFAVAQLSKQSDPALGAQAAGEVDPDDPSEPLKELLRKLQVAGRRAANILLIGGLVLLAIVVVIVVAILTSWQDRSLWAVLVAALTVLSASFLLRLVVSLRWTAIVKAVFGNAPMCVSPEAEPDVVSPRRYAIGATGLNDGHLYSFTSHQADDAPRWLENRRLATPLGNRYVSTAVIRATSLPGLGQLGATKIWLPTCAHDDPKHKSDTCEWVPDRLVDGGISGIFGRGLVRARPQGGEQGPPPTVVVVDAGRSLEVNNDRTVKDRASGMGERLAAMLLMVRWLKVALFVAYRDELGRVRDDQVADGYSYRLVRLAEEEDEPGLDRDGFSPTRHEQLNRLYVLRDQLHRFSLTKASQTMSNRAITVAVAACALEFEHTPDIAGMLEAIGERLGRGRELADAWRDVRVPLLGQIGEPGELGPEQVGGAQPIDQGPRQPEVAGQSR